jgi:DNA polymerase III epsilon subunit-like protein
MAKYYCVLDLETDLPTPTDERCNPVQIGCLMLNYDTLEEIPNSRFNSPIKPFDFDKEDYKDYHSSTLQWHCKLNGCTLDDLLAKWAKYPDEKTVCKSFVQYLKKYNPKETMYTAPTPVGANLITFDLPIIDRLLKRNGINKSLFFLRGTVDVQFLVEQYLHYKKDAPKNYKMDTLREYFDIKNEGAHDALFDVITTAAIFRRFWKWQRVIAAKTDFRVKIDV